MESVVSLLWIRSVLGRMDRVSSRPEFGGEAFFVGDVRFAGFGARGLVLHLAPSDAINAMKRGLARPFLSVGAMQKNGWVEFATQAIAPEVIEPFLQAAHAGALQSDRRHSKRPARRRDRKPLTPSRR